MAISMLESQLSLLNLSLQYPDTLIPKNRDAMVVSPFVWSDEFTKQDLITLISGIFEVGSVKNLSTGDNATYKSLVTGFEIFFNVKLPQAYKKRGAALGRTFKTVAFLERMIRAITDKNQR